MTGGWLPAPGPGASVDSGNSFVFVFDSAVHGCTPTRRGLRQARSEQQELLVALARARLAAGALSRPLLTAAAWSSFSARGGWVFVFGSAVLAEACVLRPEQQELLVAWRARGWLPALEPGVTCLLTAVAWSSSSTRGGAGRGLRPEHQALLVTLAGARLDAMLRC